MILGLTGCPGSGKSVLASVLVERGWALIDADRVGKDVVERDARTLAELVSIFGTDILDPAGKLDRRLLARRAFSSPENTRLLNGAVHPVLIRTILGMIDLRRESGEDVVVDCALIYEWGIERHFDRVLCVRADEDIRRSRLALRDGRSPDEIGRLFSSQIPEREKVLRADIVLANNGTRMELAAYGLMIAELPHFLRESGACKN